MKLKIFPLLISALFLLIACDDSTGSLGLSMSEETDHLTVQTDTFTVLSQSYLSGPVVSRNTTAYLGKIRDPETKAYITGNAMLQYASFEGYTPFPAASTITETLNGKPVADSCEIRLYYTDFYGDELAPMKIKVMEMGTPMTELNQYYSDFDPVSEGYIRTNGISLDKAYTLNNKNLSDDDLDETDDVQYIRIKLEGEYTDPYGNTYNNFGSYILQTYYAHPEYFANNYQFVTHVVPGFYFQCTGGLGAMAYVHLSQLRVFFSTSDENYSGLASFGSTEEVLQTTTFENDNNRLAELAEDTKCTYIKSPAGIFTELTIPVDNIMAGHENDTINTAKLVIPRINNSTQSDYQLNVPQQVIMIPEAELNNFFANSKLPDNKTSFLATFNSSKNTYTFSNISNLVNYMHRNRNTGSSWNKVLLIPISTTTVKKTINGQTVDVIVSVVHDMSLTSTKLVGGVNNPNSPLEISVVYSKFK